MKTEAKKIYLGFLEAAVDDTVPEALKNGWTAETLKAGLEEELEYVLSGYGGDPVSPEEAERLKRDIFPAVRELLAADLVS